VLLAIDTWADEASASRHVALKCMRRPAKLGREAMRRRGLPADAVLPLLRCHAPAGAALGVAGGAGPSFHAPPTLAEEAALRGVWPHVAVLPRCDTTLAAALAARPPAARAGLARRDWAAARSVAVALATAAQALHDASLIHAEIKPANIAFASGGWRLIDLDAACSIAPRATEYLSDRCSAAFCPPEMVYFVPEDGSPALRCVPERGVLEAWGPGSLKADVSYDMWSYGAVLYHIVTGAPLWPDADAEDALPQPARGRWRYLARAREFVPIAS
jgi:hypothetical protein